MHTQSTILRRLVGAALTASLLGACTFGRQAPPTPIPILPNTTGAAPAVERTLYTVQRGGVVDEMSFTAKVSLASTIDLYFGASGRVQNVFVRSGDEVELDEVVAVLETRGLELDRAAAQDALDLARQRLAQAEVDHRFEMIRQQIALQTAQLELKNLQGDSSSDPLDVAIAELSVRQAELSLQQLESGVDPSLAVAVRAAESALQKLDWAMTDAQISAPFAGQVLLYDGLKRGNLVQAYTPVAAIVDPKSAIIEANLVPADLEHLWEGMDVRILLSTPVTAEIDGVVRSLPQPFGSGSGSAVVIAPVDPAAIDQLRPGASVEIKVNRAQAPGALWLPPAAIQGYKDNYYVRMADGSERRIVAGIFAPQRVEIVSGLQQGDVVAGD